MNKIVKTLVLAGLMIGVSGSQAITMNTVKQGAKIAGGLSWLAFDQGTILKVLSNLGYAAIEEGCEALDNEGILAGTRWFGASALLYMAAAASVAIPVYFAWDGYKKLRAPAEDHAA